MKNQQKILDDILKLKSDLDEQGIRLPPGLAGMYGEILAWREFEKRFIKLGYAVEYFSGQKGADLLLKKGKTKIQIEIKTSRLKDEGFGLWYGAALAIKNCRIPEHSARSFLHKKRGKVAGDFCYFNFLVFVKLDDDFSKPQFYIFPRDYIWKHEKLLINTHGRFTSSTHRIILSNGKKMPVMPNVQLKLILEMEKFKNRWELIK